VGLYSRLLNNVVGCLSGPIYPYPTKSVALTGVDLAPLKAALAAVDSKQLDPSTLSAPIALMQAKRR
jgi:hypothetical protein